MWIAVVVLAVPLGALAWWLGSPLFIDTTVDEAFPEGVAAVGATDPTPTVAGPSGGAQGDIPSETTTPETAVAQESAQEAAQEPVLLLNGSFVDADSAHRGSGSVGAYQLGDGSRLLRFEDFEVTNGPDLHVLLVPTNAPIDRELLAETDYFDLGKLKGNVGNQNYEIPADVMLDGSWTVVIYCEPFHVVFSTAQLSA
jgi:hypothetical protein